MKTKILIISLLILCFNLNAAAIQGIVLDATSNLPVSGAKISVLGFNTIFPILCFLKFFRTVTDFIYLKTCLMEIIFFDVLIHSIFRPMAQLN